MRKAAVGKYGKDVVITSLDAPIEHSSKENEGYGTVSHKGFKNAAAEWWLMGYAHYHVITQYR